MIELTDLEIRKQITLIKLNRKYPNAQGVEYDERQECYWVEACGFTSCPLLNPLTDDTLVADLIDKYYLEVGRYGTWYGIFQGDKPQGSDGCLSYELSLRKAVALAVILLAGRIK